jgi:hypothetical protein
MAQFKPVTYSISTIPSNLSPLVKGIPASAPVNMGLDPDGQRHKIGQGRISFIRRQVRNDGMLDMVLHWAFYIDI